MRRKPMKNGELESGENEDNAIENDAVFGDRHAEDTRILACRDDIATRKVLNTAEKRRSARLMLHEIGRIREPTEGQD